MLVVKPKTVSVFVGSVSLTMLLGSIKYSNPDAIEWYNNKTVYLH